MFFVILLVRVVYAETFTSVGSSVNNLTPEESIISNFNQIDTSFNIFPGMNVQYRLYNSSVSGLEFYSDIPLWYGIYGKDKFSSSTTPYYSHIFEPSLISPEDILSFKSLFDLDSQDISSTRTFMPFASVDSKLMDESANLDVAIFFNNPNTLWDSPQWMNLIKTTSVGMKAVGGLPDNFIKRVPLLGSTILKGLKLVRKLNKGEKGQRIFANAKGFLEGTADFLHIAEYFCMEAANENGGTIKLGDKTFTVQDCGQYFETTRTAFKTLAELLPSSSETSNPSEVQVNMYKTTLSKFEVKNKINVIGSLIHIPALNKTFITEFLIKNTIVNFLFEKGLKKETIVNNAGVTRTVTKAEVTKIFMSLSADKVSSLTKEQERVKKVVIKFSVGEFGKAVWDNILKEVDKKKLTREIVFKLFEWMNQITKLRESIEENVQNPDWESVLASTKMIFNQIVQDSIEFVGENIKKVATEALKTALADLEPLKVFKVGSAFIEGGDMMWHYVTSPEVVYLNIDKQAGNKLSFERTAPSLMPVRYLSVNNDDLSKILSFDSVIERKGLSNDRTYYIVPADSESKLAHFLVSSGFKASVENHAVIRNDGDKSVLENFIDERKVWVFWHSYKYNNDSSKGIGNAPKLDSRNLANSFSSKYVNFWESDLSKDWFVMKSYSKDTYPILDNFIQSDNKLGTNNISYLDFSKIYHDTYLTHTTPGVYNDATWFKIGEENQADLYANTFNVYVLEDLSWLENSVNANSNTPHIEENVYIEKTKSGAFLIIEGERNKLDNLYITLRNAHNNWSKTTKLSEHYDNNRYKVNIGNIDTTVFIYSSVLAAWEYAIGDEKFRKLLNSPLDPKLDVLPFVSFQVNNTQLEVKAIANADATVCIKTSNSDTVSNIIFSGADKYITNNTFAYNTTICRDAFELKTGIDINSLAEPRKISLTIEYNDRPAIKFVSYYPFTDIIDEPSYYAKSVIWAWKKGIINGYSDGTFGIRKEVTRAELLKIALSTNDLIDKNNQCSYEITDTAINNLQIMFPNDEILNKDHWARGYIYCGVSKKIVHGYENETFLPDNPIIRAEAAKIFAELFIEDVDELGNKCPEYSDIGDGEWPCKYLYS